MVVPLRRYDLERTRSPALAARARENLAELRTMLAERRDRIVERRGVHTYGVAQRLVWLAERRVDIATAGGDNPVSDERELAMAATTAWIRDQLGDGGWVLVHAHNLHVGREFSRHPKDRTVAHRGS